ncbi:MAG: hypothetical protein EBR71_11390, partial [Planctomycetes bacterium]|nr:hypothetical protein [Planctomycetota bacterium]
MKTLLLTVGSHGDVHPFMDIAAALQRAGHTATLATNPHYQPQIQGSGLAFAALGEPMDIRDVIREQPVMDSVRGPLTVMRTLLLPEVPALVQRMRELIHELKPDVVVLKVEEGRDVRLTFTRDAIATILKSAPAD